MPDMPINAVFLFLFIIAAAMHMGLFKRNQKRGKKFVFNAMTFGISTTTLRLKPLAKLTFVQDSV